METTPTPSHDEQTLHVCYCFDAAYARWAGISLYSLMKNLSPDVAVVAHCIHEGTSEADQSKFQTLQQKFKNLSVKFLSVESAPGYKPIGMERGWPNSIYFRLYMADLIECERIAFLDCDTLVTGNISTLNDIDLNGSPIAAVVDSLSYKYAPSLNQSGTVFREEDYFNSGFLLVDLPAARTGNIFERALEFCRKRLDLKMVDQDALNLVLDGKWQRLAPSWNTLIGAWSNRLVMRPHVKQAYLAALRSPTIIHFTGGKPWTGKHFMPHWRLYLKYWKESPWGDSTSSFKIYWPAWVQYQLRKIGRFRVSRKQIVIGLGSWTLIQWNGRK